MRRLGHAVLALAAGAGLALYAATRTWSVRLTERPGLPELRADRTGAAEMPWLLALALVALAGAGALLATRGAVRRGLGVLLVVTGAALAVCAVAARAGLDPGAAGAGATIWPAACVVGGALVVLGGLGAARHGGAWPTMGTRYERRAVPQHRDEVGAGSGPSPAAGLNRGPGSQTEPADQDGSAEGEAGTPGGRPARAGSGPAGSDEAVGAPEPLDSRAVWEALDRGEDPTAR